MVYFQAIFKGTFVAMNRSKVRYLIHKLRDNFWRIEDVKNDAQRSKYEASLRFLKIIFFTHFGMCVIHTIIFGSRPVVSGNYSFDLYVPDWIPKYVMLPYQLTIFPIGLFPSIVGLDLFILNLIILIQVQFKMLNDEVKKIFEVSSSDYDVVSRIKKCVDHHNFLIG